DLPSVSHARRADRRPAPDCPGFPTCRGGRVMCSVCCDAVPPAPATGRPRHGPRGPVMKNIYVGNLTWDCSSDDLLALFQEHGKVARAQVITDRETGRSRGFGFVEMDNDDEAQRAIEALNGADYKGRPLTVNEAKPREEHG